MAKRKTKPAAEQSFAKHVVMYPQGLNLRAGPGKDHDVLRVLKAGEEIQQAEPTRDDGWMRVDGGWVDSRFLQEV